MSDRKIKASAEGFIFLSNIFLLEIRNRKMPDRKIKAKFGKEAS